MKKIVFLLAVLLFLSVLMNVLCLWYIEEEEERTMNRHQLTRDLAYQLFFDNVDRDLIEIFVSPIFAPYRFQHDKYTVRIRPLYDPDQIIDTWWGYFLGRTQTIALYFACSRWEQDRELSRQLIKVLAKYNLNAHRLWENIENRESDYEKTIRSYAYQYQENSKEYIEKYPRKGAKGYWFRKGRFLLSEEDFDKGVKCLSRAAKLGHPTAQYQMGLMFHSGEGVEQNYDKAKKWFEKAVARGQSDASYFLGGIYDFGLGSTKQNYTKALKYYQLAAEADNLNGLWGLGMMHAKGKGVEQNYEKAAELFREAAERGDNTAAVSLGWLFEEGLGVKKDWKKASALYEKAALNGDAYAANCLAYLYAERGINLDRAEELIQSALKEKPEDSAFIDTYGWVLYKQGKYEEALNQLTKAIQLDPDDADKHDHLAHVYLELGQEDKATEHWQKALELTEDDELKEEVEKMLQGLD